VLLSAVQLAIYEQVTADVPPSPIALSRLITCRCCADPIRHFPLLAGCVSPGGRAWRIETNGLLIIQVWLHLMRGGIVCSMALRASSAKRDGRRSPYHRLRRCSSGGHGIAMGVRSSIALSALVTSSTPDRRF
jgi:hypothetical protein